MSFKAPKPGRPRLGKEKRVRLSMTLKPSLVARLDKRASASGVSASRLVEELLEAGLRAQNLEQGVWQSRLGLDSQQIAGYCRSLRVKRLSLFGSVLTDKFGPKSDVDVLVEFEPGAIKSFFQLGHVQMEFERIFGRPVDLTEPRLLQDPYRRSQILGSALEIYAA
jgi:predicted nucleotidyltransferase